MRAPLDDLGTFTAALTGADVVSRPTDLVVDDKGTLCNSPDARDAPDAAREDSGTRRDIAPKDNTRKDSVTQANPSSHPSTAGVTSSKGSTRLSSSLGTVVDDAPLVLLTGGDDAEIITRGSLSRGGMGDILLAEQRSIGRTVAVKVAHVQGKYAETQLVVEARVAGQLDHPNIVPVHILGTDEQGKPLIVMKRIEGRTWKELLHAGRDLSRDVAILMDVCRALHFAHARGVVHRDLKPANVMVGTFGEVYLLDWGIAVGFGDHTLPELPHARDVRKLAGTPQYMAPEMAFPEGNIDARTDIFLAGAVLHEIITGRPPHAGASVEERLYRAHVAEEPDFDDDVPEEIADICRHAIKRDPRARYQSAEELRTALAAFQSHAAARELCEAAEGRLAALLVMPPASDGVIDGRDAQQAFTECRFGFSLALRTWPGSLRAREGLERAVAGMAWREASAGHYDSARLLAAELDPVPPALAAQLDDLKRKRDNEAADAQALQRIQHERDVTIGAVERAFVVMGSATSWLFLLVAMHFLDRNGTYSAASGTLAIVMGSLLLCVAGAGVVAPRIRSTVASRAIYLTLLLGVAGILSVHIVGWWFALPPAPMLAVGHTVLAATLLTVAAHDNRLWLGAGLSVLVVPAIVIAPELVYLVSGIGCFVALAAFSTSGRQR